MTAPARRMGGCDDEGVTHGSDDRWCEVLTVVLTVVRVIGGIPTVPR
jgi:hypothetical protein